MRFATIHVPAEPADAAGEHDTAGPSGQDGSRARRAAVVVGDDRASAVVHVVEGHDLDDVVALGLPAALELGERAVRDAAPVPLSQVRLGVPVRPGAIRDFVAFEEHVEGVRQGIEGVAGVPERWYAAPTYYFTNPHRLLADGDDVAVPGGSVALDLELEVGAVVGTPTRDADPAHGRAAIFGYTLFNDWSARDLQGAEMQVGLGPCKGKDFATSLGPWIVTADELEGRHDDDGFLDLACRVEIDGRLVGADLLSHMGWTFGALVAYASRDSLLRPGDVLGSGTTGNGGCLAELWGRRGERTPPPLTPGSVVTITVEGLGSLTNRVVAGRAPAPLPAPRRFDAAERAARREARGLPGHAP